MLFCAVRIFNEASYARLEALAREMREATALLACRAILEFLDRYQDKPQLPLRRVRG